MARMDSLSFRVRTMSWNDEKPTVQTPLDKQAADGRWSNLIPLLVSLCLGTKIQLQTLLQQVCAHEDNNKQGPTGELMTQ